MINFLCSHCGTPLRVRPELAGTSGRCPRCGKQVEAPLDAQGSPTPASSPSGREKSNTFETAGTRNDELDVLGPPQGPGELGRLGEYRIIEVLGTGGMGVVYRAEDIKLKRHVALKVMKKAYAASQEFRLRFLREAQSAAAIEHDHIVTIYQVDEDRGVPFLAMKLLLGESLEHRLNREGKLPVAEILRIGREIAEGLAVAHERGLIHRDVKPANIWLEEGRDRVKIVDFGLALDRNEQDPRLTDQRYMVGTPMYMSPEQATSERDVDQRTDLFSLGGVLYRMSTGTLPFPGKTTVAVLTALATKKPRPPRELNPELPRALARLITRLLSKQRNDRPHTARLVLAELAEISAAPDDEEVVELEVVEEEPVAAEVVSEEPRRRSRPRPRPRPELDEERLARRVIVFAIVAGVFVFLLLVVLVVRNKFFKKTDDDAATRQPPPGRAADRRRASEVACLRLPPPANASTWSPSPHTPTTWKSPAAVPWPSWPDRATALA